MNLKKSILSGIAAVGLMASLAAPVALAQPAENAGNNTTNAHIAVDVEGEFDVYFWVGDFDMPGATLSASSPVYDSSGTLRIQYTDTLPDRPNFNVTLIAGHFTDGTNYILNDEFTITGTYNVQQFQWGDNPSKNANGATALPYDVGDIGYFVDQGYPSGQVAHSVWSSNNVLNDWVQVQFGYAGVGTVSSYGDVDVALHVPATTVEGTYTSLMTLNVIAGDQP
jgi:hypothetical protein